MNNLLDNDQMEAAGYAVERVENRMQNAIEGNAALDTILRQCSILATPDFLDFISIKLYEYYPELADEIDKWNEELRASIEEIQGGQLCLKL